MNWIDSTVGKFCPFIYGKGLPQSNRKAGNVPVYGSNGRVDYHDESYVKPHGIIIGRKGSVGAVHLCEEPFWPIDTAFYVEKESIDELRFTYYLLKSLGLEHMNSDSAVPGLNRENAHSLTIKIPEQVQDRKALGAWIAKFDKKIALNRQINQTLESMAQAIFKSWFVDFDPVKAKIAAIEAGEDAEGVTRAAMRAISGKTDDELDKMEGWQPENYARLKTTAGLFPSAMQDSELGEVPEGWVFSSIYDIAEVIYGAPFKSKLFNTEKKGIPLIRIRDLRNESPGVFTDEQHPKGYFVQAGDLLVGMDGEFRPYLWGGENSWLNQRVCCFSPKDNVSTAFVKYSILPHLSRLEATATATTVIHLGKGDIDKIFQIQPNKELLAVYNNWAEALFCNLVSLKIEARYLSQLRDTLLPKLLSGELSVDAIEMARGD